MKKLLCLLLALCLVLPQICTAFATEPKTGEAAVASEEHKSIKIFTIGHSYAVNANHLLPRVLKEAGYDEIVVGEVFAPGCSLSHHYSVRNSDSVEYYKNTTGDPRDWKTIKDGVEYPMGGGTSSAGDIRTSLAKALADEDWDIIVMQTSVSGAGRPEDECYNEDLGKMIDWVKANMTNPDAKFAWHMLWANEQIHPNDSISDQQSFGYAFDCDEAVMYKGIIDTVQTKIVPNENFDYIIPAGTLVQNLRNVYNGGSWMTGDSIHADHVYAAYPIAMLWAEVLLGVDADTINYIPELDEFQSVQKVQRIDEEYLEIAHDAINKTLAEPYKVTIDGPQELYPIMAVDFGEPVKDGDNYKYTATVYLEQYGNIHGVGAVDDGTSVTDTGNLAGLKIKDWNLDIAFENASDLVSVGGAASSLKVVGGYKGGNATYIAQDMSAAASGSTVKITSKINGDEKKAYPYYGITRYHNSGRLALGTFEVTTKTNNFKVNMTAGLQYGTTYADGSFIEDTSKTTYVTNNDGSQETLLMDASVMVGQPTAVDNPDDGLITSEAELRAALAGPLSKDKNNPTKIVLGADIIIDDGAATDDLTDGTLELGTDSGKVYVDISGAYTIKNMQNLSGVNFITINNAVVNITDTIIDVNYANDNPYAEIDKNCKKVNTIRATTSAVTLNGTATLKNSYGAMAFFGGKWADTTTFTMNDNSKITGLRLDKTNYGNALIYVEGYGDSNFTMNGGEISGNVFAMRGAFHVDANHRAEPKFNGGKIINNDISKMTGMFTMNQGGSGYINPEKMTFDEGTMIVRINSGSTIKINAPLTQKLIRKGGSYNSDSEVIACFEGRDGYKITLSDLQNMATITTNAGNHSPGRVLALNPSDNKVYSYVNMEAVPNGYILQDGTTVDNEPLTEENILGLGNGTLGVGINGQTTIKYDNAYATRATFKANGKIQGVGVLFIPKEVLGAKVVDDVKHGLTINGLDVIADAYDNAPTLLEDDATIEVIAALKGIPRIFTGDKTMTLVMRPYIMTKGKYLYAETPDEALISDIGSTGEIPAA